MLSDYNDREFAARFLAYHLKCSPNEWRYDGTHAAGNQMLQTVDFVMGALKARGWTPGAAAVVGAGSDPKDEK